MGYPPLQEGQDPGMFTAMLEASLIPSSRLCMWFSQRRISTSAAPGLKIRHELQSLLGSWDYLALTCFCPGESPAHHIPHRGIGVVRNVKITETTLQFYMSLYFYYLPGHCCWDRLEVGKTARQECQRRGLINYIKIKCRNSSTVLSLLKLLHL